MQARPVLWISVLCLAGMAMAAPITYTATLTGPGEEPANASPGTGFASVTFDDAAHTLAVNISFSGLLDNATASHIHLINGPGDLNTADTVGPVATTTPSFPSFPLGVTSGTYSMTFDTTLDSTFSSGLLTAAGSAAAAEAALGAGLLEGRAYVNIHTGQFPGGEIRGFLSAVPEPASLGLIGLGLLALGIARRYRPRM